MKQFLRFNHTSATFYEILEIPKSSSLSEIKLQFKKLSKKYHPDLNNHLPEEEKKHNSDKFIRIVNAYETLKDKSKRAEYDRNLSRPNNGMHGMHMGSGYRQDYNSQYSYNNSQKEWQNLYYGYNRNTGGSRMNRTRHKVHNFSDEDPTSTFLGEHKNYGDRFNVPHFNYEEHLLKHLKFEQRIINKQLTPEEREAILQRLTKNADILDISEELITKHMMRHVNNKSKGSNGYIRESITVNPSTQYMYQKPSPSQYSNYESETDYDDGSTFKMMALAGGTAGSILLAYKLLG